MNKVVHTERQASPVSKLRVAQPQAGRHELLPEGESTAKWAIRSPGFLGSTKQLLNCARCGEMLPTKRHNEPRHFRDIGKPSLHVLCDACYEQLPDDATLASFAQVTTQPAQGEADHAPAEIAKSGMTP